jgi:hypothetical protein
VADPGEPIELTVEQDGHLVYINSYDEQLNWIGSRWQAKPGYQMNGHRDDCRCETCRPDILRLPEVDGG